MGSTMNMMPPATEPNFESDGLSPNLLIAMLRGMMRIREFELTLKENLEPTKRISTPCHLYIGQEAVAVGVCSNLNDQDMIFGNHRSHGHYLAKGGDMGAAMAEIFCKQTGCSSGRGGSMHLVSVEKGILGTSSIVGGTVPLAVGAGLSKSLRNLDSVSVAFHGDSVPEEGVWNESANLAAINNLPVLFICENNMYSTHLPLEERRVKDNLGDLAAAHGLRTSTVDGNNVLEVYNAAKTELARIRSGEGPAFIECRTYRWLGHVGPRDDLDVGLRSEEEVKAWVNRCPIRLFNEYLIENGTLSCDEADALTDEVNEEVKAALTFAEESPKPDPKTYLDHIYKDNSNTSLPTLIELPKDEERSIRYVEAIREGHHQALAHDELIYILGQGVDNPWCVGTSTEGLLQAFGKNRVRDVPICENAMTGTAIGSAMAGMRPLVFHPRMDFMYLAMDQMINHCAYWFYMFGGQVSVPVTIRGIINRRGEQGSQHSQSPYALYAHIPGLKIVMPTTPFDAKGLLLSALFDDNPVLYFDDRSLYESSGNAPEYPYLVPLGRGDIRRGGSDLTIVAISCMVQEALKAADILAEKGVEAEVIDPRTIKPMDFDLILESSQKTGRLIIADPAWPRCGVASDVAARVSQELFGKLKAPVQTVTFPDSPIPASFVLEEAYYPDWSDILRVANSMF
ncbi:MAG: thiamine pyrophosphate-dependent enzyme [Planctomycetota bacterium]|nr:thiamine pyrophosphate-dependent enzyme [Planctomycetota bacterium]